LPGLNIQDFAVDLSQVAKIANIEGNYLSWKEAHLTVGDAAIQIEAHQLNKMTGNWRSTI